jgi:UDP-N-acetylmuramate--alanine ligase
MKRVIISGGGTGGHIFPAIAIANALKAQVRDIEILFIGAKGRMEMEKVPAAGYQIEGLPVSGFQRRLTWKNFTFPIKLLKSLLKARSIISKFKPDLVIGVGGYASGPTLRMATASHIPALIQEQNSFPGVTNRLLSNKVQKICVAYAGMEKYFPKNKIVFTGNPVRQDVMNIAGKRQEALRYFGLTDNKKTLLVIGGSLGAGTINQAVTKFVKELNDHPEIQILWQTGLFHFDRIMVHFKRNDQQTQRQNAKSEIQNLKSEIQNPVILPFIDRMDFAYAAADVIVSRAGAIAISELCVVGKPVVLIPSPNVAEDHQTKNARTLEKLKAAILIPDMEAVDRLGSTILDLLKNENLQSELKKNIAALGVSDAAEKIAGIALSMVEPDHRYPIVNHENESLKSVYFIGIGGIGMSALAKYYASQGILVTGYDKTRTVLTDQLMREGMQIHFTEDINLLPADPGLVIYTPAIPADHQEFRYYKERGVPMKKRAEVLGMISGNYKTIAVAGTHGKTTTSTMIAHILKTAGTEMLAFLGGISINYRTNYLNASESERMIETGEGNQSKSFCVVEADEFDRSFLQLVPYIAVITSADADHLDIYGNHDDMKTSFGEFTSRIVEGGALVMKTGTMITPANTGAYRIYDYSLTGTTAFYAENIHIEEGLFHFDFVNPGGRMSGFILGVAGKFNLENAIAALTVGYLLGIHEKDLRLALLTYQGVQRRFEFRVRKADLVYVDDYAHHPEELRACISAIRELFPGKKITGVFQPHLYSRTRDFADDFARSLELLDELILLDIYPAREKPIEGVTSQMLLDRVNLMHKKLVKREELLIEIKRALPEILLTLGAGDIDQFVEPITELLNETII